MPMTPRLRKFALTAHVVSSVGWLGAVVAYLPLAVTVLSGRDAQTARAAYPSMELIGWYVIVPLSLAALLTGIVQSLGTSWGLFRHYWVLTKFLLTVVGTLILLKHMLAVSRMSAVAAEMSLSGADLGALRQPTFVVHAVGGLLVLLTATTLSVYKPWGMTRYGRRRQRQQRPESRPTLPQSPATPSAGGDTRTADATLRSGLAEGHQVSPAGEPAAVTRRRLYVLLGIIGLVLLFVGLHLAGGDLGRH